MRKTKKWICLLLVLIMLLSLSACGGSGSASNDPETSDSGTTISSTEQSQTVISEDTKPTADEDDNQYKIGERTVLFKNTQNWDKKIYVYYWSDSDKSLAPKWPGVVMEPVSENVYSYDLPAGVNYIIFTDDNVQTRDIKYVSSNHKYQPSDKKDAKGCYYVEAWDGTEINTALTEGGSFEDNSDDAVLERITAATEYFEREFGASNLAKYKKTDYNSYIWDTQKSDAPERDMPFDITIDGLHITSGYLVSELLKNGYNLSGEEDHKVEAQTGIFGFYAENTDKDKSLKLGIANFSDATKTAKDCSITEIVFNKKMDNVSYQGLSKGSSIKDAISKLGLPEQGIKIYEYHGYTLISMHFGYILKGYVELSFAYNPETNTAELADIDLKDNVGQ